MPDLSIIVVTYNSVRCVADCVESIHNTKGNLDIQTIIVDNDSTDETIELVRRRFPSVTLIAAERNLGFPAANNLALTSATANEVLLLNPDTILHKGALAELVGFSRSRKGPVIVGLNIRNADGTLQSCGMPIPHPLLSMVPLRRGNARGKREPDGVQTAGYVSGAAPAVNREAVNLSVGLDEELFWWEDVDFCRRAAHMGIGVYALAAAKVTHLSGVSAATNLAGVMFHQHISRVRYFVKHSPPFTALCFSAITLLALAGKAVVRLAQYLRPTRRAEARARLVGYWRAARVIPSVAYSAVAPATKHANATKML